MSYYAKVDGTIKFKSPITQQYNQLEAELLETFDSVYESGNYQVINLYGNIKYDTDSIFELLSTISDNYEIVEAEIEYIGEDTALWRHIYIDGKWKEQYGEIKYKD